ncbi:MAG TPA: metal-dependent hydrolase [Thermodesulfobacteriota bacterium]|nr:metal-dependent hydrolase [Thermodesulfobacteriota bacterium]
MATPIGHSLAGLAVYGLLSPRNSRIQLSLILLCVFMANIPDFDFLPGILKGKPALYHQGITHSIGFALTVSLVATVVYRAISKRWSFSSVFILCFFSYLSHLIIDFFSPDAERPPFGIPIFWPFSDDYFVSPVSVFLGVRHASATHASTVEWIRGIVDSHNLVAIALEVILIIPLILFGRLYRKRTIASGSN